MRKKIATLLIFATAIGMISLLFARKPTDPLIDGKPISQWSQQLISPDYMQKDQAITALQKSGLVAIPHLLKLLETREHSWQMPLRKMAARFHLRTGPFPNPDLCQERAAHALQELGIMTPQVVRALVNSLPHANGNAAFQIEKTLRVSREIGETALRESLDRGNSRQKIAAARVLAYFAPLKSESIGQLIKSLDDRELLVRLEAVQTLGALQLGSPPLQRKMAILGNAFEASMREAAAIAMGKNNIPIPEAEDVLEKLWNDQEEKVRLQAAIAHWKIFRDGGKTVPTLSSLLQTELSWQAAYALADMGKAAAAAIPGLIEALQSERVPRIMRTPPSASLALGRIGAPAIEPLLPLLDSPKPEIQIAALLALSYMGAEGHKALAGMNPLLNARNLEVRHAAALAMAEAGAEGTKIIAALSEVLNAEDIYMRSTAAKHLRRMAPGQEWTVASE